MSLLNDMLRDLSTQVQGAAHAHNPHEQDALTKAAVDHGRAELQTSGLFRPAGFPWLLTLTTFLLVLVVLWLLRPWIVASFQAPIDEPAVVSDSSGIPLATVDHEVAAEAADVESSAPTDTGGELQEQGEPATDITQQVQHQRDIDNLLAQARQALARDRLTSPFEDNAYRYYQQILSLDATNPLAQQGILQLAERYLAMAQRQYHQDNVEEARALIARAQLVAPVYEPVQHFASLLLESPGASVAGAVSEASKSANQESSPAVAAPVEKSVSIQEPFAIQSHSPVNDNMPAHLSVAPNPQWQDTQQVEQARRLWTAGQTTIAVTQLEQFVAINPQTSGLSSWQLLDFYVQQENREQLALSISAMPALNPAERDYFQARLALLEGDGQQALNLLERHLATAQGEHYRALLAGLYQKHVQYAKAAQSYKALLETFGEKPAYWLGYALALDAMDERTGALRAYQRLAEYSDLQVEVRDYIQQRIAALRG